MHLVGGQYVDFLCNPIVKGNNIVSIQILIINGINVGDSFAGGMEFTFVFTLSLEGNLMAWGGVEDGK